MKIITNEYINMGGGCMVLELTVENGGELKSIGITEECIAGYNCEITAVEGIDNQTFLITDADDLQNVSIPQNIIDECIKAYHCYINKYNRTNQLKI